VPKAPEFDSKISISGKTISNGLVEVTITDQGRINLADLETGTKYNNLIYYTNQGDIGNGWYQAAPWQKDIHVSSLDAAVWQNVSSELVYHGALSAVYKITGEFIIPEDTCDRRAERVGEVALKIETFLTITHGEKRVDVKTIVHNNAKKHMLQVKFPVSDKLAAQEVYFADTAFDCLNRDVKPIDTTGWVEQYRAEAPIKTFVGVKGENENGLAIITKGICEGNVIDDENRTINVTLFRSFSQDIEAEISEDSLLQGELVFEYSIVPIKADENPGVKMFTEADKFKIKPMYRTLPVKTKEEQNADVEASFKYGIRPRLTPIINSRTLAGVDSDVVISTIKVTEKNDGIIFRVFNPSDESITAKFNPNFTYKSALVYDLKEDRKNKLPETNDGSVEIALRGKEVLTLCLTTTL